MRVCDPGSDDTTGWNFLTSMNDLSRASQLASEVLKANNSSLGVRARALLVLADAEREFGNLDAAITSLEEATRLRRSDDNWRILWFELPRKQTAR